MACDSDHQACPRVTCRVSILSITWAGRLTAGLPSEGLHEPCPGAQALGVSWQLRVSQTRPAPVLGSK